jgi:A/G-specific adenine glycosylase
MLVARNNKGEVLLQRRPPAGIWGGLLSFPEIPLEEDLQKWCERHIGVFSDFQNRPILRHTFSHFHLAIHPIFARLRKLKPQIRDDNDWSWFKPGVSQAGLAAPVSTLIAQLQE